MTSHSHRLRWNSHSGSAAALQWESTGATSDLLLTSAWRLQRSYDISTCMLVASGANMFPRALFSGLFRVRGKLISEDFIFNLTRCPEFFLHPNRGRRLSVSDGSLTSCKSHSTSGRKNAGFLQWTCEVYVDCRRTHSYESASAIQIMSGSADKSNWYLTNPVAEILLYLSRYRSSRNNIRFSKSLQDMSVRKWNLRRGDILPDKVVRIYNSIFRKRLSWQRQSF